jgi:hypothetical protein
MKNNSEDDDTTVINVNNRPRHEIKRETGQARKVRQFCNECYKKNSKRLGSKQAKNCTPKVVTFCGDCEEKPFLCLECFNKVHRKMN